MASLNEPAGTSQDQQNHALLQRFHSTLLALPHRSDHAGGFSDSICRAWVEASEARFAALWLYNPYFKNYQLSGAACPTHGSLPEWVRDVPDGSIAAYALATGLPVVVADVRSWSTRHGSAGVEVSNKGQLADAGLLAMCAIPLGRHAPDLEAGGDQGVFNAEDLSRGVVMLHFASPAAPVCRDDDESRRSLSIMASLTAFVVHKWRRDEQFKIATALARLTERHVTRSLPDPKEVRADYLDEVIRLLEAELRLTSISIWVRVPLDGELVCAAAKGLRRRSDGRVLTSRGDFMSASYQGGQGTTGRVFESGVSAIKTTSADEGFYLDLQRDGRFVPGQSIVLPINAGDSAAGSWGPTVGVLRCGPRCRPQDPSREWPLDIHELETLGLVAQTLSSVLHMFESRIQREDAIQIVKHDLHAPLVAIRDAVDTISDSLGEGRRPDWFYITNLRESAVRLGTLSDLLARDLTQRRKLQVSKTLLESIVAPMKRMLTPFARETSGMEIRFDISEVPPLNIDRSLIERALYNLLVNAIKYGERGTTISINGLRVGEGVAIDVVNRGVGVDGDHNNLFKMYYRSPRARALRNGQGLGLALVRQIMRSHDGDAELFRDRDPTIFRLLFPASRVATRIGGSQA